MGLSKAMMVSVTKVVFKLCTSLIDAGCHSSDPICKERCLNALRAFVSAPVKKQTSAYIALRDLCLHVLNTDTLVETVTVSKRRRMQDIAKMILDDDVCYRGYLDLEGVLVRLHSSLGFTNLNYSALFMGGVGGSGYKEKSPFSVGDGMWKKYIAWKQLCTPRQSHYTWAFIMRGDASEETLPHVKEGLRLWYEEVSR